MTPQQMIAELRGLERRAAAFASVDVWKRVAEVLYEGFTDNFATRSNAEGEPWKERKSKTAKNPLLILSSLLIRSVGGHASSIYDAQPFELTLGVDGSGVEYAAIHNEGSGRMPQREYLNVNEGTRARAAELYVEEFSKQLFP